MRLTDNDKTLSNYFASHIKEGSLIPYITQISMDTGISISTISRYAIRKGYYNFPEMRAKINNDLETNHSKVKRYNTVKNFISERKDKKFVITTSVSCQSVGYHISKRLEDICIPCRFIDNKFFTKEDAANNIREDEVVIFITITGESAWLHSLEKHHKNETIVVSMQKIDSLPKNYKNILLPGETKSKNIYDKYASVRKIFIWADDILNTLTIESKNKIELK